MRRWRRSPYGCPSYPISPPSTVSVIRVNFVLYPTAFLGPFHFCPLLLGMGTCVHMHQRRLQKGSIPEAITEDVEGVRWIHDLSWYVLEGLYCPLPTVISGMFYEPLLIFSGRCGAFYSVPKLLGKKIRLWSRGVRNLNRWS